MWWRPVWMNPSAARHGSWNGRFVNLFDSELRVRDQVTLDSGSRQFLLDLDAAHSRKPHLLASACRAVPGAENRQADEFHGRGRC